MLLFDPIDERNRMSWETFCNRVREADALGMGTAGHLMTYAHSNLCIMQCVGLGLCHELAGARDICSSSTVLYSDIGLKRCILLAGVLRAPSATSFVSPWRD